MYLFHAPAASALLTIVLSRVARTSGSDTDDQAQGHTQEVMGMGCQNTPLSSQQHSVTPSAEVYFGKTSTSKG